MQRTLASVTGPRGARILAPHQAMAEMHSALSLVRAPGFTCSYRRRTEGPMPLGHTPTMLMSGRICVGGRARPPAERREA